MPEKPTLFGGWGMAEEVYAYTVAVVGSADVVPQDELQRLLEVLVNRYQATRRIVLLLPGRDGPHVGWSLPQHWSIHLAPFGRNKVKLDCELVAFADALVVLGDPALWARLLRLCREARIPTRVDETRPRLQPSRRV
jgi:hypothetical protein